MKKKWFIIIIASAFAVYFIIEIIQFVSVGVRQQPGSLKEYDGLFKGEYRNKIVADRTLFIEESNPVSMYIYDEKYFIYVFKFTSQAQYNLSDLVKFEKEYSNKAMTYSVMQDDDFELRANFTNTSVMKKLLLRYDESLVKLDSNGLERDYFMEFNSFSTSLNNSYGFMLWGLNKSKTAVPICISFLKKGKYVYMIWLTRYHTKEKLPATTLVDILNHN